MKKTTLLIISLLVVSLFASAFVFAKPNKSKGDEIAPGVFYLGKAIDKGKVVEGYAFVHDKKSYGKPGTECGNGICEPGENINKCPTDCGGEEPTPDTSSCYGFLAKNTKWKTLEPYLIDSSNTRSLTETFISNSLAFDISTWESAASYNILGDKVLGNVDRTSILGNDNVFNSNDGTLNEKNEVIFADIEGTNAIAVTIVWGIFGGPPFARELVEWDMVFDEVSFDWSEDCAAENCTDKMDFENIATHELGHAMGMNDLYASACSEQTMYGYADFGEINKRTLEAGDIIGINKLYS